MKKFKFALMCAAALAMVACTKPCEICGEDPCVCEDETCEVCGKNPCECPTGYVCPISVEDATADDWAKVPEGYLFETKCAEGASWDALKSVKVFADDIYVNLLVEWDPELVSNHESVPFHVYWNVDGDAETGGYGDQWLEPYNIDVLMEGFFFVGEEGSGVGEPVAYEPGMFAYGAAYNTNEWNWSELTAAGTFCFSQHLGDNKMEIQFLRELIPASWGEEFTVGFDIQQHWESVGVLPNAADDEIGNKVKAEKMRVQFYIPEE
ncbi:MAG: hypothetical protein E7075_02085 [Bacteroidales bacterium]|nr:hypothetical protein [Bacteroidales bacterium]